MIRIVHITAHMGGGVGRALVGLVAATEGLVQHTILCLETPQKHQSIKLARDVGAEVLVEPDMKEVCLHWSKADIVQLEFWNHPALLELLCSQQWPETRTILWSHTSGLSFPTFPPLLMDACHHLVMTSSCSTLAPSLREYLAYDGSKCSVISSCGGMDLMPIIRRDIGASLKAGYVGTLNFSKLNPDYVHWLSAVDLPDFCVRLIGDIKNRDVLEAQCLDVGKLNLLDFAGYCEDVATELSQLNVMIYLLNPCHYGTAEIALIEAMSMGVVPIVLANACELAIVEDGVTGFVVESPEMLKARVHLLNEDAKLRCKMAENASIFVRKHYTYKVMGEAFVQRYYGVLAMPKEYYDFSSVFGTCPADWFRSFVKEPICFSDDGNVQLPEGKARFAMLEHSKGSVLQFADFFPEDVLLRKWKKSLCAAI